MSLGKSESLAPDEDALHAHGWDLIPEYSPFGVLRDTHFLHTHGRPLESRRPPPERPHRAPHSVTPAQPPAPHPRTRLPLLSVSFSLLSIDDASLHLVAHSPAHSAPFPDPIRLSVEKTGNAQETASLPHSSLRGSMRPFCAVACDESILPSNPFRISASPLIGLLGLVRGIWAGGWAALREVYG
jgi:hypothetical protein